MRPHPIEYVIKAKIYNKDVTGKGVNHASILWKKFNEIQKVINDRIDSYKNE